MKGKVQRGLASLKKFTSIFSQSQTSNVYHELVENHILYADIIWGSLSDSKKESLQHLHHRAISLIDKSRIKDDWLNKFLQASFWVSLSSPCPRPSHLLALSPLLTNSHRGGGHRSSIAVCMGPAGERGLLISGGGIAAPSIG